MTSVRTTAAVDLGKTSCRLALDDGGRRIIDGPGAPGLAAPGGVDRATDAILALLDRVPATTLRALGVGAAGAWAAPDAAADLAVRLARATGAAVAVASDVVTAHAGALRGGDGVILISGTGAAAMGVDVDGIRLVDGWGPDIGDFGSGSWLGREAVRAVQRAQVGLGPATELTDAVRDAIAPAADPVAWVSQDGPVARRLGTLAPLVLDAALTGDYVAREIAQEAVRLLTASAVAASSHTAEVVVHGGLTGHDWFRSQLVASLAEAGRSVVAAQGDALDGAALLAAHADLPHERFVHRAE
ncbi:N-acetylglucosamine kinase [Microbacterium sp. XT11]|uniref:N-acetylglucosamine kinase n=1 Tax=Microbacterium sp. XT11 TaxID=367477 RepID=UPI00082EF96C|nr:BadF/BadG/BcrA/BcrD ATPase family protein [Microbacterium sp. XT11]